MGKGTKHKVDWKETTLQVVIDARRLLTHSAKIMGNEKEFNQKNDFHDRTLIAIYDLLLDTYSKVWEANRINVGKHPELKGERFALQQFAKADCERLLSMFELVKPQFHIKASKFWNWMNMLVELGKKISAWHKKDVERYGAVEDDLNGDVQSGKRLKLGQQCVAAVC